MYFRGVNDGWTLNQALETICISKQVCVVLLPEDIGELPEIHWLQLSRLSEKPKCFNFGEFTYSKINCLHVQENLI